MSTPTVLVHITDIFEDLVPFHGLTMYRTVRIRYQRNIVSHWLKTNSA